MELPPIFDEFFTETSVWFLIFMLVSFLLGALAAWWANARTIRILRRQIARLRQEIVEVRAVEATPGAEAEPPADGPGIGKKPPVG